MRTLITAFGLTMMLAFGQQLDSNSITVSASRNTSLEPDQAIFAVFVDASPDMGMAEVLAAIAGSGITSANFSSVASVPQYSQPPDPLTAQMLEWAFALPVPIAKVKDTTAMLSTLAQNIAQKKNGMTLSFSVQGTQVSPQALQAQICSLPDLLVDARSQAQKLADAAQLSLGPVLALWSTTSGVASMNGLTSWISVSRYSTTSGASFGSAPNCSVTVKFGLTRL